MQQLKVKNFGDFRVDCIYRKSFLTSLCPSFVLFFLATNSPGLMVTQMKMMTKNWLAFTLSKSKTYSSDSNLTLPSELCYYQRTITQRTDTQLVYSPTNYFMLFQTTHFICLSWIFTMMSPPGRFTLSFMMNGSSPV